MSSLFFGWILFPSIYKCFQLKRVNMWVVFTFNTSVRISRWSLALLSVRGCVHPGAHSAGMPGFCGAHPNASGLPTAVTVWIAAAPRNCWAPPRTSCLALTCSTANSHLCTTVPKGKVGGHNAIFTEYFEKIWEKSELLKASKTPSVCISFHLFLLCLL